MKIGISELLVIFVVALIVVGPDKLPGYARKLGEALAQFRKTTEEATRDIRESIVEPLEEAQKPLRDAIEPLEEMDRAVRGNVKEVQDSFAGIGKQRPPKPAEKPAPEAASTEEEPPEAEAARAEPLETAPEARQTTSETRESEEE